MIARGRGANFVGISISFVMPLHAMFIKKNDKTYTKISSIHVKPMT